MSELQKKALLRLAEALKSASAEIYIEDGTFIINFNDDDEIDEIVLDRKHWHIDGHLIKKIAEK